MCPAVHEVAVVSDATMAAAERVRGPAVVAVRRAWEVSEAAVVAVVASAARVVAAVALAVVEVVVVAAAVAVAVVAEGGNER